MGCPKSIRQKPCESAIAWPLAVITYPAIQTAPVSRPTIENKRIGAEYRLKHLAGREWD